MRGGNPLVTGKRVLLALGLWLLAAVVIGTATVFVARSSGTDAVTAIVVGEVYTLLLVALMIVFRPRGRDGDRGARRKRLPCDSSPRLHSGTRLRLGA